MFDVDVALARLAGDQHGYLSKVDCDLVCGSDSARKRRIEAGLLVARHPGVYRHAAHPPTLAGELLAATMACTATAGASGPSAMRLYGVRGDWSEEPEITVVGTERQLLDGVRVRRIDRLDPGDVHRRDGVPVLAPPLALLLLGASVPGWKVPTAVHDMVFLRLTTRTRLIDVLQRYGGRGRRGTRAFREAVRSLDPDGKATQTNLELRMLEELRAGGVPDPHLQYAVIDADGTRRRLDMAWPDELLNVETDGDRDHTSESARRAAAVRDAALVALGWTVLRVTSADVELRAPAVVATVRRSLSDRARSASPI